MNFRDYARKWSRDENNNFAVACFDQNSMEELKEAIAGWPDDTDCREWGISPEEWADAITTAITEKAKE